MHNILCFLNTDAHRHIFILSDALLNNHYSIEYQHCFEWWLFIFLSRKTLDNNWKLILTYHINPHQPFCLPWNTLNFMCCYTHTPLLVRHKDKNYHSRQKCLKPDLSGFIVYSKYQPKASEHLINSYFYSKSQLLHLP